MATFNIFVKGRRGTPIINEPIITNSSCQSTYEFLITRPVGVAVTINYTPSAGYTNFSVSYDSGLGFAEIASGTSVTPNGSKPLRVILENTGSVEDVTVTISAGGESYVCERSSTGTPC